MLTNTKGNSVGKCLKIIGAFWALILLGPGLVVVMNNISAWFSGAGFYEGSFGYKLLVFFSQAIACVLACSAAESISDEDHQVCVLVNEIISICIFVLMALAMLFLLGEILNAIKYIIAAVVAIVYSVKAAKSLAI